MKVDFEVDYKYYYYFMSQKKEDFCCKKFYHLINDFKLQIDENLEPVSFDNYLTNYGLKYPMKIEYCPFCGEKIEYKKED